MDRKKLGFMHLGLAINVNMKYSHKLLLFTEQLPCFTMCLNWAVE